MVDAGKDDVDGLVRQAVHQVKVNRVDSFIAQPGDNLGSHGKGLNATDRHLDIIVEVLHAKAHAIHPGPGKRANIVLGGGPRVQLNRHFRVATDTERTMEMIVDTSPIIPAQHRRALAASVDERGIEASRQG